MTAFPDQLSVAIEELSRTRELRGEQTRMWIVLLEFSRSVTRVADVDHVLQAIVSAAAELTSSTRISLMLPDESGDHLRIVRAIGIDEDVCRQTRVKVGDSIAGRAFASGQTVTSLDRGGGKEHWAAERESFVSMPIVTSSLKGDPKRVGVLNITNRVVERPFDCWELEFIELLAKIAGSAIDDTLWRAARESVLKLERDLQLASEIQQGTFPRQLPTLRGFDIAAWSRPAEETGGDTYDVIGLGRTPDDLRQITDQMADHAILLLADATGHGIGPALSVSAVRSMLRMAARAETPLNSTIRQMNEQLCGDLLPGRFIASWFGKLDAAAGTLACYSAGIAPVLRYCRSTDVIQHINANGVPLGIMPNLHIDRLPEMVLRAGDTILVSSDGIIEATNKAGEYFGIDRLEDALRADHDGSAEGVLEELRSSLTAFTDGHPLADDCTALVIARTG